MTVFTFHFAKIKFGTAVGALVRPPVGGQVSGLNHAECMAMMTLGAPVLSPTRMQIRNLTMFASWESEEAIDGFLEGTKLGRELATGWHVRMSFLRRWRHVSEFAGLPEQVGERGAGYISR